MTTKENEWQRMMASDNKWQWVTANDREWCNNRKRKGENKIAWF